MNKALKYKIVAWLVALFLAFLLPQGIYKQSQIQQIAIVSGIGIDKVGEQLEVSVSVLVPEPSSSYAPKQTISSAKGENIAKAINAIEIKIGQELGLAHCYIIILGDEFTQTDVTKDLDYLMRSNIMGNNSAILHTDKKAKEILEVNSSLSENNINNLQNIAKFNQEHYNSSNTTLIGLFNDYLSETHCSVMGSISLEEISNSQNSSQNEGNNTSSPSESGSSQNKQDNSQSKKTLSNKGDAIILKNGRKIAKLTNEEIGYFAWLDTKSQSGYLSIENYSNQNLQNANITLKLKNEKSTFDASIINNSLVLKTSISFECFVDNIINENDNIRSIHNNMLTDDFKQKVQEKIYDEIQQALTISKENNFDIIGVFNIFNNKLNKSWKNYLMSLENPDDYMQNLLITIDVKMTSKY